MASNYLPQSGVIKVVISSKNRDDRIALMKACADRISEINDPSLNEINVGLQLFSGRNLSMLTYEERLRYDALIEKKTILVSKLNKSDLKLNEINAAISKTWEDQRAEERSIHHVALSRAYCDASYSYGKKYVVGYCYQDNAHTIAYYCGCDICKS